MEQDLEIDWLQGETTVVKKKIEKIAQLMNVSIPRLIEVLKEAEWRVRMPDVPKDIAELLVAGRVLINKWNEIISMALVKMAPSTSKTISRVKTKQQIEARKRAWASKEMGILRDEN
ncbi:uncharacterized protein G2W53_017539 [Senna tora]|uniref:Uncharacterized protein n=1 Tax=Senna tora TaxID=362788 RepID=A0A834TU88_9FABA|nr:uncharacterized protein G2W53_017539 [Senna tora]